MPMLGVLQEKTIRMILSSLPHEQLRVGSNAKSFLMIVLCR